jgi:hypothetical protein
LDGDGDDDDEEEEKSPKKDKMKKILGVPIPGTKQKDKRSKMARRPSWEASLSSGKY